MKTLGDVGAGHTVGRYELLLPIAKGGMAVVWAARLKGSRNFQKIVAVKSMLPTLSDDPQFEEMFLAEAELASQIKHPHVCEILDLGEQDGVLFIVMEWIDGEPLSAVNRAARQKGGIPIAIATRICMHAAQGLHAAHELKRETGELVGLVHRDVSPQNILITYDGVVKIVDFGVAKVTSREEGTTQVGQMKGKVTFMAPEQATGSPVDRRTDIFALGIVLYQLITGKHPFRGDSDIATLRRICDKVAPPTPISINPRCSPSLSAAIAKSLEKQPNRRFNTMLEFSQALDDSLSKMIAPGQDVGTFVRSVVGDKAEKRRALIKDAQRVADERVAEERDRPRAPTSLPNALVALASVATTEAMTTATATSLTPPSMTTLSGVNGPGPAPSGSGVADPSGVFHQPSSPSITGTGASPIAASYETPASSPPRPKSKIPMIVALVTVVAAAAFTVFALSSRSRPAIDASKPDGSAGRALAAGGSTAPPAPVAPSTPTATATAAETAAPEPEEVEPAKTAAPEHRAAAHAPGGGVHHPRAAAPAAPAPAPQGAPKIMNPGF